MHYSERWITSELVHLINDGLRRYTICVTNNGYFSPYFKVTRSVKQGGPNSAYFFLLLAEVLAIELRKKQKYQRLLGRPNFKKFKIQNQNQNQNQNSKSMLIDLYLWGETRSINEAIDTIKNFENKSGFKIRPRCIVLVHYENRRLNFTQNTTYD